MKPAGAKEFFDGLQKGEPPISDIIRAAAVVFDLTTTELLGRSRSRNIVTARSIAMCLCTRKRGRSYGSLKAVFDRDHTTIMHAANCVSNDVALDPMLASRVVKVWDLACQGRLAIVAGEKARNTRREIEAEIENEKILEQTRAAELSDIKERVRNEPRSIAPKRMRADGDWTTLQLTEMNEQFQRYMTAYGDGARY